MVDLDLFYSTGSSSAGNSSTAARRRLRTPQWACTSHGSGSGAGSGPGFGLVHRSFRRWWRVEGVAPRQLLAQPRRRSLRAAAPAGRCPRGRRRGGQRRHGRGRRRPPPQGLHHRGQAHEQLRDHLDLDLDLDLDLHDLTRWTKAWAAWLIDQVVDRPVAFAAVQPPFSTIDQPRPSPDGAALSLSLSLSVCVSLSLVQLLDIFHLPVQQRASPFQ